jgi:hypothetical protein
MHLDDGQPNSVSSGGLGSYLMTVVTVALVFGSLGCRTSSPTVVRLPISPLQQSKPRSPQFSPQLNEVKRLAPGSFSDNDPDICPSTADPKEQSAGGHTTRAVYEFPSQTHVDKLYARIWIFEKICTDSTLSNSDRSRLDAVLNALGVTKMQSFAATVSLTGDAGNVKYPDIVPFSYAFDQKQKSYTTQTVSLDFLPWQDTTAFKVTYSYKSSKTISINTAQLFSGIMTQVAGAGTASAVLSPAANAYLSAANALAQNVGGAVYDANNALTDSFHLDMAQTAPGSKGPVRALTYRFQDMNKKPLAGVRLVVSFTRTIALQDDAVDPTTDTASQPPQFTQLPDILNQTVGGPATGSQSLLQEISKEPSYQSLLKTDTNTTATDFKNLCNTLERALSSTYGLNGYDTALAMGEILSQNTLYLTLNKFYSSGCFDDRRGDLKSMGIKGFDTKPSS